MDYEIYNNFDEYHIIVPKGTSHEHVEVFIDHYFSDEVQLCILENVTINNIKGVGTTHIKTIKYSEGEKPKDILIEYHKIISQLKTELASPASYFDWYQRHGSFLIIGNNSTSNNRRPLGYTWIREKTPDQHEYITIHNQECNEAYLKKYFQRYLELLSTKRWFSELPHFCVIVKPISVYEESNQKFIPLGNLYLVLGTKNKKNIDYYRDFINKLMVIWLRNSGGKVLKELNSTVESSTDEYIPKFTSAKHKDKLSLTKINQFDTFKLNDLFEALLDNSKGDKYLFDSNYHNINNEVFSPLYKIIETKGDSNSNGKQPILNTLQELLKPFRDISLDKYDTINDECLKKFVLILLKRKIVLAYMLIGELSLQEINYILVGQDNQPSIESISKYLWNNLFIPNAKIYNEKLPERKKNAIEKITSTLSNHEKGFLKMLKEDVREKRSSDNISPKKVDKEK